MRKEKEAQALKKKFNISQEMIAKSLAADFVCSFFVNKNTGRYIEYSSDDIYKSLNYEAVGNDFFAFWENVLIKILYPEDRDFVFQAFNKENVLKVLEIDKAFLLTFRIIINNNPIYIEMKITNMINDDAHIVVGIRNVDLHMKRIEEYENLKKNHLTFSGLAEALATDYVALLYVDTKDDKYIEFYSTDKYKALGIPKEGKYILSGNDKIKKHIYKDDLDLYNAACNKENILRVLSVDKSFSITVRFDVFGKPVYCLIKISRMMLEDSFHVVIGISNIDSHMKREEMYNQSINEVKEIAYKDPLTGVKSKHAYSEAEVKANEEIKKHLNNEFALLVCDLNDLKVINDTLGHQAGDEYIKDGCTLICRIFKHSPVYRVGGDEFVVIIEGYDFENRFELLKEINDVVEYNIKNNKVSIAVGMSDFNCNDLSLHDVFKRADEAMYLRKKEMKGRI